MRLGGAREGAHPRPPQITGSASSTCGLLWLGVVSHRPMPGGVGRHPSVRPTPRPRPELGTTAPRVRHLLCAFSRPTPRGRLSVVLRISWRGTVWSHGLDGRRAGAVNDRPRDYDARGRYSGSARKSHGTTVYDSRGAYDGSVRTNQGRTS